jgi:hypothetical protein
VRTPCLASTEFGGHTLRVFPDLAASRTSSRSSEGIPVISTGTCPIRFAIRLPFAFWTADVYVFHNG